MLLFLFRIEWSSWWLRIRIQPLTGFSLGEIRIAGLGSRSCSVSLGLVWGQIQGRANFWSEVTEFTASTWGERRGGQEPLLDTGNIIQNARMWHCPAHRSWCSELKPSTATPTPGLLQLCLKHSPQEKRTGRISQMKIWLCLESLELAQQPVSVFRQVFLFAVLCALLHLPLSQTGGERCLQL